MLLLKVAYENNENIIDEIQGLRNHLKSKNIVLGICESIERNTHFIKILCDESDYSEKLRDMVNLYISNVIYKIVIDIFKKKEMYEFINDTYFFLKHEEICDIQEKITDLLVDFTISDENDVYCMNRKNSIVDRIKDCIEETQEINIDGFITFRMKELIDDIESIVDKIVEKYMVEKEYNEFIKLLKYFVDIQDSKLEEVNIVIVKGGSYEIKDNFGKDIFQEFLNELLDSRFVNGGINIEDIIISGLITNSPKRIIIHGIQNCTNKEIIQTINNVFGDRVHICNQCKICSKDEIKV